MFKGNKVIVERIYIQKFSAPFVKGVKKTYIKSNTTPKTPSTNIFFIVAMLNRIQGIKSIVTVNKLLKCFILKYSIYIKYLQ